MGVASAHAAKNRRHAFQDCTMSTVAFAFARDGDIANAEVRLGAVCCTDTMSKLSSTGEIVYEWINCLALATERSTERRTIKIHDIGVGKYGRFLQLLSSYQPVSVASTTPLECSWKSAPLG